MCKEQCTFSQMKIEKRLPPVEILQLWLLKKCLVLPVSWLAKLKVGLSISVMTAGFQMSLSHSFRPAL